MQSDLEKIKAVLAKGVSGWDVTGVPYDSLARTLEMVQAYERALEFYRDEMNWIKGIAEACSPIVADTGAKAKAALEKYKGGAG